MEVGAPTRVTLALAAVVVATALGCQSFHATVTESRGDVTFDGAPLLVGAELDSGGEIEIGRGRAILAVTDVGELRLYGDTRMRVGPGRSNVRLTVGRLWARITDLAEGDRFEVITHNAIAGVRGTSFVTTASEHDTEVGVIDGEVEVAGKEGDHPPRTVRAGQRTRVRKDAAPETPRRYDSSRDRSSWRRLGSLPEQLRKDLEKAGQRIDDATKKPRKKIQDGARKAADGLRKLFR